MKKGASGIEPATFKSAVECSTTELHSHMPNAKKIYLVFLTISKQTISSPKIQKPVINYNQIRRKSIIYVPSWFKIMNKINLSNVYNLLKINRYIYNRPLDLQSNSTPLSYTPICPTLKRYIWF